MLEVAIAISSPTFQSPTRVSSFVTDLSPTLAEPAKTGPRNRRVHAVRTHMRIVLDHDSLVFEQGISVLRSDSQDQGSSHWFLILEDLLYSPPSKLVILTLFFYAQYTNYAARLHVFARSFKISSVYDSLGACL